jgi:cytochrome oxidase Cu insertion factor (SCO1/SenC/PrrC family)
MAKRGFLMGVNVLIAAVLSFVWRGGDACAESAYPEGAKYTGRELVDMRLLPVAGKVINWKKDPAFIGKPLAIIPVFTSCPVTCPTILKEFQLAWQESEHAVKASGARVVVVSFDPADTKAAFKSLIARQKLPTDWTYAVAASKQDFKKLEAMLADFDFRYVKISGNGGGFAHPAGAYILDGAGKVRQFLAQAEFTKGDMTNALSGTAKRMEQR